MFLLFLLSIVFPLSNQFLIEGSTSVSSKNSAFLTDTHYYRLLDMINEESIARRKQTTEFEQYIGQLQTVKRVVMELKNQITNEVTESKEIGYLKSETLRLKHENENLRQMLNEFKVDVDQLKIDCNISKNQTGMIDTISKPEQSQIIQYRNEIATVTNKTISLENAIKSSNSRVDAITAENKARQDDFIALYNKTLSVELHAAKKLHDIEYHHNTSITTLSDELNNMSKNFTNTLKDMVKNMNNRIEAVQGHINGTQGFNTSTKNLYSTVCANLSNVVLNSSNDNYFMDMINLECSIPGLYLMFLWLETSDTANYVGLYKNNELLSFAQPWLSVNNIQDLEKFIQRPTYQVSIMAVAELQTGDTLEIDSVPSGYSFDEIAACLTIIKIN